MEYTKKHKNLPTKLFKKAGMMKEAETVLSCDDYNPEIVLAMRDAARKANVPIGGLQSCWTRQGVMKIGIALSLRNALCLIAKGAYGAIFIILAEAMSGLAMLFVIWVKAHMMFR